MSKPFSKTAPLLLLLWLAPTFQEPAQAQEHKWDGGFRLNGIGGSGKPTNDVLGFGLFARRHLNERWAIGASVDHSSEFDVERSPLLAGVAQDPNAADIDSLGEMTLFKAWVQRSYRADRRLSYFWRLGAGFGDVNVDPVSGPTAAAGTFTIVTDAGSEAIVEASLGLELDLGSRWFLEVVARFEEHFADWKFTDLESGSTGTLDDYSLRGIHLGLGFRF